MIHITKSKTGYMVVTLADNGEVLSTSEVLTSRANAIKNMKAQGDQFGVFQGIIQDDTREKPSVYTWKFGSNRLTKTKMKPEKKYKDKK